LVTENKIKVLIVDDSALFRQKIQLALRDNHQIEIVGAVSNGRLAIDKMQTMDIDICTLDMEMPELDGLETLKQMKTQGIKTKAIMFSTLCKEGAEKTLEAMRNGAYDFVAKPTPDGTSMAPEEKIREALMPKILSFLSFKDFIKKPKKNSSSNSPVSNFIWEAFRPHVLVIASSTGGPNALVEFFQNFTDTVPYPILVTQHMPPIFTASLAERLGIVSGKQSKEAVHGEKLIANQIYVAPGNFHMKLTGDKLNTCISLDQEDHRNFIRPAADFLFETAAEIFGRNTMGVVFTGMGRDGADGASAIKKSHGAMLIQSEESCVVFGMPGAVYEAGHYDFVGSPQELAQKIKSVSKLRKGSHVA